MSFNPPVFSAAFNSNGGINSCGSPATYGHALQGMKGLQLSHGFSVGGFTGFFTGDLPAALHTFLQQLLVLTTFIVAGAAVFVGHGGWLQLMNTGCTESTMNKKDNINAPVFIIILKEKEPFSSANFFLNTGSPYIISKGNQEILAQNICL